MKREVRQLKEKATNGLILAIEHFNRPSELGRTEAVLIMLDHAFEMLLKAVILHKGGTIRKSNADNTIGFRTCVNKGRDDGSVRFLNNDQSISLININNQRNAAQHYLNDLSEHHLYLLVQSGVSLFEHIHDDVFEKKLSVQLPERVLPVSTTAPSDLIALFEREIEEFKSLVRPGRRKKQDAINKMRSWALLENSVTNADELPNERDVQNLCQRLSEGENWVSVFPGVASIKFSSDGVGPSFNVRINKKEGIPVRIATEEDHVDEVAIAREVNPMDLFNITPANLAKKVNLTQPKCLAVVRYLRLQENSAYFKTFKFGKTIHGRYAPIAIEKILTTIEHESIEKIWADRRPRKRKK